ncbi:hypothetical protein J7X26_004613, partial [Vibrio parahaemolyticus]|nr:hypothetical protein [Vibrio parahaemolyticus]
MSVHPLDAFLLWLESQPVRERDNILALASCLMPGFESKCKRAEINTEFVDWIKRQKLRPLKSNGVALSLKVIVNYAVMEGITDKEQWKTQSQNIEEIIESMREQGYTEADFQDLIEHKERLQFLGAQSQKMKKSWLQFCDEHLSSDAIRATHLTN